jgi:RND family efflux transporter MFP subunit
VSAEDQQRSLAVRLYEVQFEHIPETITANGELVAEDLATLSTKVPGRVARLNVDLGSRVRQNDVIAELERDEYEVRVKQAEALIEQTRARLGIPPGAGDDVDPEKTAAVRLAAARLDEARTTYTKFTVLVEQGIFSKLEHSRVIANFKAAEAQYQAAVEEVHEARAQLAERRAQLALARQYLQETAIRAPFAGAITSRHATVGEYLAANAPVAALVRESPIRLRLEVPERLASRVRAGQRMDVRFESFPPRAGRVVRISPTIQAQNRSLLIEAEFANEDGTLRPGAFAEGTLVVNEHARGISVPAASIVSFAGVDRVFVAHNGALAERVVKTGRKLPGERVEIVSGLQPNERIVAQANDRLANGMRYTEAR